MQYAKDMYAMKGLKPQIYDVVDIPNVDKMILKESFTSSLLESDNEILDIIISDKSEDEKANLIYKILTTSSEIGDVKDPNDEDDDPLVTDNGGEIVMRKGAVGLDDLMKGEHVIRKDLADRMRKELNAKPSDTEWGLGNDLESVERENFPLIDGILKRAQKNAKDERQAKKIAGYIEKIKGKIKSSREGIIDWKEALSEFVQAASYKLQKGDMRKNLAVHRNIYAFTRERVYDSLDKCVVYIDTSGSVNNSQTQLIPVMAGELQKLTSECELNAVDIHLFDDSVYSEHYDVTRETINNEDWGIDGASAGGGTDIQDVYAHINDNYVDDYGELIEGVSCVVIITDYSGMMYSGDIKPYLDQFSDDTLTRMCYVVYIDGYTDLKKYENNRQDVIDDIASCVSELSQFYDITLANFIKQIKGDSMNYVKESLDELDWDDFGSDFPEVDDEPNLSVDDIMKMDIDIDNAKVRVNNIRTARDAGDIGLVFPELKSTIDKYLGDCKMVSTLSGMDFITYNAYYVDDEGELYIRKDFNNRNINDLYELIKNANVKALYGNLSIVGDSQFRGFPENFPSVLRGKLELFMLPNMMTFDNAPTEGIEEANINVNKKIVRKQNEYAMMLKRKGTKVKCLSLVSKGLSNESLQEEVDRRLSMANMYIKESIAGGVGGMLFPQTRGRFAQKLKKDNPNMTFTDFIKVMKPRLATNKRNKEIYDNILFDYGLGSLDKEDVQIIKDPKEVRESLVQIIKGSGAESYKRFTDVVNAIDSGVAAEEFKKSYAYNAIKDSIDKGITVNQEGLRLFLDGSDNIIAVLLVSKNKMDNGKKIKFLYYGFDGLEGAYDEFMIQRELLKRFDQYKNGVVVPFAEYGFGNNNKSKGDNATLGRFLYTIIFNKILDMLDIPRHASTKDVYYKYLDPNVSRQLFAAQFHDATKDGRQRHDKGRALLNYVIADGYYAENSVIRRSNSGRYVIDMAGKFPAKAFSKTENYMQYFKEDVDFGQIFALDFLRIIVSVLGLYSDEEIKKMGRAKLGSIVNAARDVKVNDTLLSILRPEDKLSYEYTSFLPLVGDIKKVIDFRLPSSLISAFNNNKRIYRSMLNDVDVDGDVDLGRTVIGDMTPDEFASFANLNRSGISLISTINSEYGKTTSSPEETISVYFDSVFDEELRNASSVLEYVDSVIADRSFKKSLVDVYNDRYVVDGILKELDSVTNSCKAVYDIMTRNVKKMSEIQAVSEGIPSSLHAFNSVLKGYYDSLYTITELVGDPSAKENVKKRKVIADAVKKLTSDVSKNLAALYKTLSNNSGNLKDILDNPRNVSKYVGARRIKRDAKSSVQRPNVISTSKDMINIQDDIDRIDMLKDQCVDVINAVDTFNVDNPMFGSFVLSISRFFDVVDVVADYAKESDNVVFVEDVHKLLVNLADAMHSVIESDGNDSRIETFCMDGDLSMYNTFAALISKSKDIKTGKLQVRMA